MHGSRGDTAGSLTLIELPEPLLQAVVLVLGREDPELLLEDLIAYFLRHFVSWKALKLLQEADEAVLSRMVGGYLHGGLADAVPEVFLPSRRLRVIRLALVDDDLVDVLRGGGGGHDAVDEVPESVCDQNQRLVVVWVGQGEGDWGRHGFEMNARGGGMRRLRLMS